ncbi:MAG: DUF1223 domain-containing protein [Candidatus Sulfotelmatobacter sp.]
MTKLGLRLSFLLFIAWSAFAAKAEPQTSVERATRKPVVVELFTSEGCSSCPPADVLLQKLEAQQPVAGAEIIALEEHVDYWNHDGWMDPYSSPEWTERQQTYVSLIKEDAYTPELVVDGQSQFVGNNPHRAAVEIEKAARGVKAEVSITAAAPDADSSQRLNVSVGKLGGNVPGDVAEIWLAITEDGLHSSVNRGENAGHVLQHIATLRSLHKIGIADANGTSVSCAGNPVLKFNPHWNVDNLRVTVFVQKKKSREILGAASIRVKTLIKTERAAS